MAGEAIRSRTTVRLMPGRRGSWAVWFVAAATTLLGCGGEHAQRGSGSGGMPAGGSGGSGGSGDESGNGGAGNAGRGGTAGEGSSGKGGSSGTGTGGASGSGDAAGTSGTGESGDSGTNMPDADIEGDGGEIVTGESGTEVVADGPEWLHVTSSHYYVHSRPGDALFDGRWLGSVENIGPAPVCSIIIQPTFYDGNGQVVLDLLAGTVYAPLYRRPGETGPRACIEPGERGIALSIDITGMDFDVSEVALVRYSVSGATYEDLEPSDWVTLGNVASAGNVVSGSLVNGEDELGWWRVFVFAEGDGGVPLESQDFSDDLSGIEPGYTWNFQTEPFTVPMNGFDVFFDHNVR
jgi:hypothetical protein